MTDRSPTLKRLTTPRAAAAAGVLFAAILMPFAGISFLWFLGVVRDGLGRVEESFFRHGIPGQWPAVPGDDVRIVGDWRRLAASNTLLGGAEIGTDVAVFGQMAVLTLSKTYALRMAAVFMFSLATIWLRTELMPRWLVIVSYLLAVMLLIASDVSMWLTLVFPGWVLVVSILLLVHSGRPATRSADR